MKNLLSLLTVVLLASLHSSAAALPEKLRVLSVDLDNSLIENPGVPGGEVAQDLRSLLENADPDVICLQGVLDWETAERVCKLKPGFRVITCSAFQPLDSANAADPATAAATAPPSQVAILARDRALISWVEPIAGQNGFAYALFQAGARKLGVFSLQAARNASNPSSVMTDRVLAEIAKLKKFPQNRPDAFLIAGTPLLKSSPLIEAGVQNIAAETPPSSPVVRSEFSVVQAGFIARPRGVPIKGLKSPAIVSDFDSGSSFSSKFAYQTPLLFAGETPASFQALMSPEPELAAATPNPNATSIIWPVTIGSAIVILALLMFFRRTALQAQNQLMQLAPANGQTLLPGPTQQQQIRTGLIEWLKTAFVQRLLTQRQHLLNTEDEATRRTMVIEEKLSSLQTTLQARISAYENRIERLEVELTAATAENRDLIRSQIDLLKEKVAKAKEEHAFRRN
jgi:hypothetical protein